MLIARFLPLFILMLSFEVSAQYIEGQILVYGTDKPLPNASVYYDGMYKGGISDENGNFKLGSVGPGKIPIIISAVGYHSTSIADYSSSEFIKIYLEPKTYSLDAVVVTYDGMSREEKEAIFIKEFIGITENALKCDIVNIDDINLVYNRKKGTIEASANDPIIILNGALGYKITYFLEHFSYTSGKLYFAGNYFFEPDTLLIGKDLARVEKRRRQAYLGSRMHFIRSLYNDELKQDGYIIYNFPSKTRDYSGLVVDNENGRNIFMKSRLAVIYKGNSAKVTYLDKNKDLTFINKNGFFDPAGITWSGGMASQRMGDLLPFEYTDSSKL